MPVWRPKMAIAVHHDAVRLIRSDISFLMAETFESIRDVVARGLLVLALLAGGIALIDWAIRTRRINPFNPVARFFRRWIDPLLTPLETMLTRRGGQPQHAPFFAFMI